MTSLSALRKTRGFTLIELLVVIGILAVLLAITLVAINPAKQFAQANDTQRQSDVNAILNAVNQYMADNNGTAPAGITATPTEISLAGINLCSDLVPLYLAALPVDPTVGTDGSTQGDPVQAAECAAGYATAYEISVDAANNRITVAAPQVEQLDAISVTR